MSHGEEFSNSLVVEVSGRPIPDDIAALLVHGYVDDSSNVPDLFVLRFNDEHSAVLDKAGFRIGAPVRLMVQSSRSGGPVPLLFGEVTALECEADSGGVHTIVRGMDHSHRLFRGTRVEAYVQCTAADIARQVAKRAGLEAGRIDTTGTILEHVSQDGVSDWDFLSRLGRETGSRLGVVEGALQFTRPVSASEAPSGREGARQDPLVVERGVNLVALRASVTAADQVPEVEVRGWDMVAKEERVATAPPHAASARPSDVAPADLARQFKSPRHLTTAPALSKQDQCDAAARSLAGHLAGAFAELDGTVRGNPRLRAGTAVTLVNVGEPFEGQYTLSSTRHDFSPEQGYLTSFAVSNDSERSLYGVVSGVGRRSVPVLPGVVSAIVTDVQDPEQLGRVKVRFPVLSDAYESWWARVVQPGAGPHRGTVLLPEVNDEVLVAFGQNDFEQPYVIGGLYNGKDKPDKPWAEHIDSGAGSVKRRSLTSRTGMLVEFLEGPDGERLTLSTGGGRQQLSLVQKPNAAIEVVSEGPVQVNAKKDVTVSTETGTVSMKGNKVLIEAATDLDLKGTNVRIAGSATTDVKGMSVKVAGDTNAELSGGAQTTVRGAVVRIN